MLYVMIGLIGLALVAVVAAASDPIGWGYLLSTNVDEVADAREAEPLLGIPPLYVVASLLPGVGLVLGLTGVPPVTRWLVGVLASTFVLGSLWDLRRRRGTLAVYIRLRRVEIGFEPKGGVIEVPKLMFLVMNQPTPLVWLLTALALAVLAAVLFPYDGWLVVVPLVLLAAVAFYLWLRNRSSAWEPLARRLRRASFRSGMRLVEHLEHALDLDPEVAMLRHEADSMVARLMSGDS